MVAGGFAVATNRIAEIEEHIRGLRQASNISEFHWSQYRGGARRVAYHALVKYAFELIRQRKAELHVIIANLGEFNHKQKPGENRASSVSKMYWQLGLHRVAAYYGKDRPIIMRLDRGNDSKGICERRASLCAAAYFEYDAQPNCVREITPVCSTKSELVQMADVVVGAIATHRNKVIHSPKNEKGPLADLVLKESGHPAWERCTPKGARGLTVWNHKTAVKGPA